MSAELLPCVEIETAPSPGASVIWLHGLGADGNDFVPIVPELRLPASLPLRFVFPHAPVRPVTINNGMRMRAWYDIAAADLSNRADLAGVRQSQSLLEALIGREKRARHALGADRAGGVLAGRRDCALHGRAACRAAGRDHRAVDLSRPLRNARDRGERGEPRAADLHGARHADPMVRYEWAEASRRALEAAGYRVDWRSYRMEHSVCLEEIVALGAWLARVLS